MHAFADDTPALRAGRTLQVQCPPQPDVHQSSTCLVTWEIAQIRRLQARVIKQLRMLLVHPLHIDTYHSAISAVLLAHRPCQP